jgi:hypothetical protein
MYKGVARTADLDRIVAIERRIYPDAQIQRYVCALTDILKTPNGMQILRPIQALALLEAGMCGGLLAPIHVGGGKTLISLLIPAVVSNKKPLLLVPANLIKKTQHEISEYANHWRVVAVPCMSYQLLGRAEQAHFLDQYKPDLIICDEVHRLRNPKAAVTRRVRRYLQKNPTVKFVGMSGTITKQSIRDYAHLSDWALKRHSPLPKTWGELEEWSDAIDECINPLRRILPGALEVLYNDSERTQAKTNPLKAIRSAFNRRLVETPGIVATSGSQKVGASIQIRKIKVPMNAKVRAAFKRLREDWVAPDNTQNHQINGLTRARDGNVLVGNFWQIQGHLTAKGRLKSQSKRDSCNQPSILLG